MNQFENEMMGLFRPQFDQLHSAQGKQAPIVPSKPVIPLLFRLYALLISVLS